MGGGRSGNGGGSRDNARWGGGAPGAARDGGHTYYGPETPVEEVDARMTSQKWERELTDEEREAVEDYTSKDADFDVVNDPMRTGKELSPRARQLKEGLESAIEKFYLKENTIFHRRGDASLLNGADTLEKVQRMYGKTVTDSGFMSTATRDKFEVFTARPVNYHIKTPQGMGIGAYVKHHSTHGDVETEFLFNHGTSVKIVGAYVDGKGELHVNCEYVGRTVFEHGKRVR